LDQALILESKVSWMRTFLDFDFEPLSCFSRIAEMASFFTSNLDLHPRQNKGIQKGGFQSSKPAQEQPKPHTRQTAAILEERIDSTRKPSQKVAPDSQARGMVEGSSRSHVRSSSTSST
jgi:hypothetical protein